jgi:hypothetical protein
MVQEAATNLVLVGVDPKRANARLGHFSAPLTLGIYARVTAELTGTPPTGSGRRSVRMAGTAGAGGI